MLVVGNTRVANSSEKNRIEFFAEHVHRAFGKRDPFAQIFLGAPVEFDKFQVLAEYLVDSGKNFQRLAGDVDTDSVTRDNSDAFHFLTCFALPGSHSLRSSEPESQSELD